MKILAIINGVGYGDSTRDDAILTELSKKVKNPEIIVLAYDNSYKYFSKKYKTIRIHGYNFTGYNLRFQFFSFLIMNILLPISWLSDALIIKRKLGNFKPDIILTDLEPLTIVLSKVLNKKSILLFGYDPRLCEEYSKNNELSPKQKLQRIFLNFIYNNREIKNVIIPCLINKRQDYGKFKHTNVILRTYPNNLEPKEKLMKKLGLKKQPILVMLGGSVFGLTLANKLLKEIKDIDEDFLFFGYTTNFSRDNIKAFEFKENFLEYLKVCKGIITLAGYGTLSEVITFKKPALVFPIKNHIEQMLNAHVVKDYVLIGDESRIIDSIITFISTLPELESKISKLKIPLTGKEEAVKIILENKS